MLGIAETNEKIPKTIECLIIANSANRSSRNSHGSVSYTHLALIAAGHGVGGVTDFLRGGQFWNPESGQILDMEAVSYTHLDVYKRQVRDGGALH